MGLARLVGLLIQTFGVFVFGSLVLASLRRRERRGWTAGCDRPRDRHVALVGEAVLVVSFLWFVVLLALNLLALRPGLRVWPLETLRLFLTYLFPPLIMHLMYVEIQSPERRLHHPAWRACLLVAYPCALGMAVFTWLGFRGSIAVDRDLVRSVLGVSLGLAFAATAIYSGLALHAAKAARESGTERSSRRTFLVLLVLMLLIGLSVVLSAVTEVPFHRVIELVSTSMPLLFLFAATYHDDRFEFFDLFVKQGLGLSLTIVALTAFFGAVYPRLEGLELGWARPWVFAVVLLPLALGLPAVQRRLGRWLDNVWLGRRFGPVEAIQHFLADLRSATTEADLKLRAERGLETIFGAPVRMQLELAAALPQDFDVQIETAIHVDGHGAGTILAGRRRHSLPWFHHDVALLESLADVFGSMLGNVRLQQRDKESARLTQELSLQASRSELRALRAQINPHFLFNALNAIAGLIHQDPLRADRTVEQLAEVFRYTLRGSQCEWTRLEEELEFVRSYLEVEQARFGRRLTFTIEADEGAGVLRIPTMLVQTLVENAVKHGIAVLSSPGRVDVSARLLNERLCLAVADTGPGPRGGPAAPTQGSGYGLDNVRRRLDGHFGGAASLTLERDEASGRTVATVVLPLLALRSVGAEDSGLEAASR